jgi:hypothetical protein
MLLDVALVLCLFFETGILFPGRNIRRRTHIGREHRKQQYQKYNKACAKGEFVVSYFELL